MDWLNKEPFKNLNTICYHKGHKEIPECNSNCKIIKLPNVGRCDHTYLHHIIENYDTLADVTFFTTASWPNIPIKQDLTLKMLNRTLETKDTTLYIFPYFNHYNFQIDNWTSTDENNRYNEETETQPSPIRPFGLWFDSNFPGEKIQYVQYKGIFAVSREHIQNRSKEFYKKLIKYLDSHPNPEAGHYMERAWATIFQPIPEKCISMIWSS